VATPDPSPVCRLHPVLLLTLAGVAVRLALAAAVPLTSDEAYYADWARHLQPGYLDHPPAVAWLIAGGLALLGHTTLAVRLPAILLQAGSVLLAADLAQRRGGRNAGLMAALLLQLAPVYSLGGVLMTPDALLGFAWLAVLWAVERAFADGARWLLLAGVALGLGLLSKLTAGLLGVAVFAALLVSARGRALLRSPWPWLGVAAAVLVASPVIWWNATRGWPSLAFQARHGLGGRSFSFVRLAASIGAQLGYVSPVLLVLSIPASWRALRGDPADRPLAFSALPVAAFFTLSAALTPGALPHWPAPAWMSAAILLARYGHPRLRLAAWVGGAMTALVLVLVLLPLPLPGSPLDELRGWRDGAEAAKRVSGGTRLAAAHWMAMGHLSWAGDVDVAYVGARASGPNFYQRDPLESGEPLLVVVVEGLGEDRAALEQRLGPLDPAGQVEARSGERLVRRYLFFRLH